MNIYNDAGACSTAGYRDLPSTLDERREWLEIRAKQGYPVVVDAEDDFVNGFGTFGDFRPGPWYRHTIEHSVYVRPDARRRAIGSRIVEELVARARVLDDGQAPPFAIAYGMHEGLPDLAKMPLFVERALQSLARDDFARPPQPGAFSMVDHFLSTGELAR